MRLDEFIETNKEQLVERWERNAVERLSLSLDASQLRNNLPDFIDDVVQALRVSAEDCRGAESAKIHGRQRMRVGVDIGGLTEEMMLVGETVAELAFDHGVEFSAEDLLRLMSIIGQGAATSVSTYAALRDKQLADQAAQHFSFVAHEIRNPLHSAHLAAQALAVAPSDGHKRYLDQLDRSLSQLAELVDDALMEARLYGDPHLRLTRLDSRELVERVRDDLASQARERNVGIEIRADDFTLEADRTIIVSALTNLLQNAIKFTRKGGHIVLEAHNADNQAVFEVADQCGGIPEHLLPKLFERFVQATPEKGGSGLGLLIVKQALAAHGGTVRVDNLPGIGCRFLIKLPLAQEQPA